MDFAVAHGVPVAETPAGRTLLPDPHPLNAGGVGIIGSASANALAADTDLVLAVGSRPQDFTTSSWRLFARRVALITDNAARFDAVKRRTRWSATPARRCGIVRHPRGLARRPRLDRTGGERTRRLGRTHRRAARRGRPDGVLSYAQAVGVVNDAGGAADYVLTSSGTMPGELDGGWRVDIAQHARPWTSSTVSCMGYEMAGTWGGDGPCPHSPRRAGHRPARRPLPT